MSPPAAGPVQPADTRRSALVAAARRVIRRRGFASAKVSDITREAGASVGLLNYYFASKDEVLAEAFADLAREDLAALEAIARRPAPAPERLAAFLESSEWQDHESWSMWVDAWGDAVHAPAMRATLEDFARGWRRVLADVLDDGIHDGSWSCPDPQDAAARLIAAQDGIGLHATLHPGDVPPERASAWARRLAELELGVTLPALLEQGRAAWLAARLGAMPDRPELAVAGMCFEVLRPVTAAEHSVIVSCALDRVGRGSVRTVEALRTPAGAVALTARTTLVPVDAQGRPRPLLSDELEALAA